LPTASLPEEEMRELERLGNEGLMVMGTRSTSKLWSRPASKVKVEASGSQHNPPSNHSPDIEHLRSLLKEDMISYLDDYMQKWERKALASSSIMRGRGDGEVACTSDGGVRIKREPDSSSINLSFNTVDPTDSRPSKRPRFSSAESDSDALWDRIKELEDENEGLKRRLDDEDAILVYPEDSDSS
jgi:hypothetical protein